METLGGIIWDITKYLCGCAKQEVDFICDLEENLRSLEEKWKNLEARKKDVEEQIKEAEETGEMQRTHEVNVWLESIQNIQKEIEDILAQGTQEIENKCLSKCCPKNCKSSYTFGKNVANMLPKVDNLNTEGKSFGKDHPITQKLPRKPIGQIPLDETVGQDLIFEKVWKSIEDNKVGVIGLFGTGGVGKTTLLKTICNELGKKRSDLFVIWVVVSKEPNLDRIMDNIRKSLGIGKKAWNNCNNQEEKSAKIWGVLKQKKFVLLLDDVWERLDLSLVGVPHPKDSNFESKVLFTTRLEDVCAKMRAERSHRVEFLKGKEALELFHMNVGEETLNSHPRIKDLAKDMAAECKGLPLALMVVGRAMAGVKSVEAWESSKKSLTSSSLTFPDLETRVFSRLKLSYDRLPNDVHRKCFLYCSLYPEDYEILVTDVIDKWIVEGFLCENMTKSIQDIRNDGQSVVAKLKLCCLLESVEDDIVMGRSFKMHDMIRDMALWLACGQEKRINKVLLQGDAITTSHDDVEKWQIVERISMMIDGETWRVPPITCPNLVTLFLKSREIEGLENIKHMSKLKVLELIVDEEYKLGEIGELVFLEYLSLMTNELLLPMEFKNLKNLKVLNVLMTFDDDIGSIPLGVISSLQKLRVLRVFYAGELFEYDEDEVNKAEDEDSKAEAKFLEEVESLPKIEELNVAIRTQYGLKKLLHSDKLQSCIYALRLWRILGTIEMPLLFACISKMKLLQQFAMISLLRVEDSGIYDDTCHLTMLQCVYIMDCPSLKHVTWLKYAPFLQVLAIAHCLSMEEVIKEEATKDENVFSSLVILIMEDMPELKSIHKTALSFPSLKAISISECPDLKKLPLDSNSVKHQLRHIYGEEDWWNGLEWDDAAAKHHLQSKFKDTDDGITLSDSNAFATFGLDFLSPN